MLGVAKRAAAVAGRSLGLFEAARRGSEGRLRILGYHGLHVGAAREFRPRLFMDPALFRARVERLRAQGFDFLTLDEGLARARRGALSRPSVVITIDDGFASTHRYGLELMAALRVPMTVYVTTYYVTHQNPVFGLAVNYLFWRTSAARVDLRGLDLPWGEEHALSSRAARAALAARLVAHGEGALSEAARVALARELGARLGVSYDALAQSRDLHLMSAHELRALAAAGFQLEMHTHRHRLPREPALLRRELEENREVLAPLGGRRPDHLCYPGGSWVDAEAYAPHLAAAGVVSATTDAPGFVGPSTPAWALPRFLDDGSIPELLFDAEVSGFTGALRWAAGRARG